MARSLFFLAAGDARMMAAPVDTTRRFEVGIPQTLFSTNAARPNTSTGNYAVVRDGQRWLINSRRDQAAAAPLTVVVNWLSSLAR
ncbi:MAG: hypothetical protein ACRD2I_00585 [Vicinamibacterales bacterium]